MESRIAKTKLFFDDRKETLAQLCREIENQLRISEDNEQLLAVRLNTFSDITFERQAWGCIPQSFPTVQFWDYSKPMDAPPAYRRTMQSAGVLPNASETEKPAQP